MICSPSKQACETDTKVLLNGHKVRRSKWQWASEKVTYLGHVIVLDVVKQLFLNVPRPDLQDPLMARSNLVVFVDHLASHNPDWDKSQVGYSVVTEHNILASGSLASHCSAQAAELVAAAQACEKHFFTELTRGVKKCCLMIVDMFSKVFPPSKQDAGAVTKASVWVIIPRCGIPGKLSSEDGAVSVSTALKQVRDIRKDIRHHCAYHPARAGAVGRENASIKSKLNKCAETGLGWIKALPIVIRHVRHWIRVKHGLSPF